VGPLRRRHRLIVGSTPLGRPREPSIGVKPARQPASAHAVRDGGAVEETDVDDRPMFERINELAREEEELWEQAGDGDGLTAPQRERLETIRVELDQCYDLLHQRQGRRDAGQDPDEAQARPADVVERYQQ
jgi:hypothetical protein